MGTTTLKNPKLWEGFECFGLRNLVDATGVVIYGKQKISLTIQGSGLQ